MVLDAPGFAYVYWIHLESHKDFTKEGYIGVSSNPARRWKEHIRDAKGGYHANSYLGNAIRKYKNELIHEPIFAGTLEQCYAYEKELRPTASIGWNLMTGGRVGKASIEALRRGSEKAKATRQKLKEEETLLIEDLKTKTLEKRPLSRVTLLRRYNSRNKSNLTMAEFMDYRALKNKEVPPSKANLAIFDILSCISYENCFVAAEQLKISPLDLVLKCDKKDSNLIYLKDL